MTTTSEVIDLRTRYGRRYRVTCEESCESSRHGKPCDPWYAIIPCRYGHIGVWGPDELVASVAEGHGKLAGMLRRMPECQVVQDGDDGEANATFHVRDFAKVAKVMKPRRRRQLSDQQKRELTDRLAKYRFGLADNGEQIDEKRAQTARPDPEHPRTHLNADLTAST